MKHFLKFLLVAIITVVVSFVLFEISNRYKISTLKNDIDWSIEAKDCKDSVDFEKSDDNTYIAFKTYVKVLNNEGREEILFSDESLSIEDILFQNDKMYFISNDKIYNYDISNKSLNIMVKDIPYEGKYLDRKLIIKDNKLLVAIGSATNAGIADNDGTYDINNIPYDKSPINIVLTGNNYGESKTGAYMPYGNSSMEGQKIKAENKANSSIIEVDLQNNNISLFACGIRNVSGWDLDSEENLICIVGGMENIGDRPINRDFDYLYKIEKGKWYGWPDFSGGDPITSPRFKNEKIVSKIINNPPNKLVAGPIYQFSNVNSIKYLAIDRDGEILEKNSSIYYDKYNNLISALNESGVEYRLLKLKEESVIKNIQIRDGELYILDSKIGCIYKLKASNGRLIFNLPKEITVFILILLFILLCIFIMRLNNKKIKYSLF